MLSDVSVNATLHFNFDLRILVENCRNESKNDFVINTNKADKIACLCILGIVQ